MHGFLNLNSNQFDNIIFHISFTTSFDGFSRRYLFFGLISKSIRRAQDLNNANTQGPVSGALQPSMHIIREAILEKGQNSNLNHTL